MTTLPRFLPSIVFSLVLVLAQQAVAGVPLTVNAGIGGWVFDRETDLDETTTPWMSLEYAFNDRWAAEFLYAKDDSEFSNGIDADVENWQLGVLLYGGSYIGETPRVRPYATFGAGEISVDGDQFDTDETTLNAGAGIRWMVSPRFGVRLEAKLLQNLDEKQTNALLSAGLNYYFGQVQAADDGASGVAAGAAAVYADLDADGDGVPDDQDRCPGTPAGTRVDAVGCPLQVERIASIKLKVNFDFDSTVVKEQYFTDIGALAEFLAKHSDLQVEVEGHTDSTGPEEYNQSLSERRARAVVDLLVNQYGVERDRLRAVGYGESRPVADNDSREGRAQNRRVMATLEVEYEE